MEATRIEITSNPIVKPPPQAFNKGKTKEGLEQPGIGVLEKSAPLSRIMIDEYFRLFYQCNHRQLVHFEPKTYCFHCGLPVNNQVSSVSSHLPRKSLMSHSFLMFRIGRCSDLKVSEHEVRCQCVPSDDLQ